MLLKIFAPVYFARENVRTPTIFAMMSAVVDIILALLLARWLGLGHVGVALATIGAAWINVCQLIRVLYKNKHYAADSFLWGSLWRITVCGAAMVIVLCLWPAHQSYHWGMFIVQSLVACGVYGGCMYALGLQRLLKRQTHP
jgi:putative peptidoglycan lipid II flippase